ncbi:MAG: hypothetical protein HYY32_06665 [Chloroflexi bacterium]|nr:hypothetical protein [Chloroflexota bacterium]
MMAAAVGSTVHPWYKGTHEWHVKGMAELETPIKYEDTGQGEVVYAPKILRLSGGKVGRVLWFSYWMATKRTKGKIKWGQGPPVLEEPVLLELLKNGVRENLFTRSFLKKLHREIGTALGTEV